MSSTTSINLLTGTQTTCTVHQDLDSQVTVIEKNTTDISSSASLEQKKNNSD